MTDEILAYVENFKSTTNNKYLVRLSVNNDSFYFEFTYRHEFIDTSKIFNIKYLDEVVDELKLTKIKDDLYLNLDDRVWNMLYPCVAIDGYELSDKEYNLEIRIPVGNEEMFYIPFTIDIVKRILSCPNAGMTAKKFVIGTLRKLKYFYENFDDELDLLTEL